MKSNEELLVNDRAESGWKKLDIVSYMFEFFFPPIEST